MSRFTVRKLSDEERGGTSPSGRFAVRKLEQALPGGSRGAVAPLPNLSLQAAKAGLQTGSTPISGAAVDRFFPAAAPSLSEEEALRAEVRTRSGSPAPLPTARPSAGLMLPTGAALQPERAASRRALAAEGAAAQERLSGLQGQYRGALARSGAFFDVPPAGSAANDTPFDVNPATVGRTDGERSALERAIQGARTDVGRVKYLQRYQDTRRKDTFTGQFAASFDMGQMGQDEAMAWNDYLNDPTQEKRAYAEAVSQARADYTRRNAAALDADASLPWISQSLAGYLPQLKDQTVAGAKGALAGGLIGSAVPGAGTALGVKVGYTAGRAKYGYDTARGAAFKALLDAGVPEDRARAAASDEAVIQSIIEGGDAALDLITLGGAKAISSILGTGAKAAAKEAAGGAGKRLLKALAGYGLNILGEGAQEWTQEGVSIANQGRSSSGLPGLVGATAGQIGRAVTGRDPESLAQMNAAGAEGMKIAALAGGGQLLANTAITNTVDRVRTAPDRAIDSAYGAMQEHGLFTPETWAARQQADQKLKLLPRGNGQTALMLPTGREDAPVVPSAAQGGANVQSGTVDTPAPQQTRKNASTGEAGSTAVNTDPTRHTPQEQAVINEYQNAVDASLVAFVNKWKTLKNPDYKKRIRMPIAEVSERAAHDVQSATGIDVTGFEHVLSGNALEHIEKRHGASGRADQSMTDVNDIGRMGYVLENYDSVDLLKNDDGMPRTSTEYANADDTPAPMVQFQKKVNGTYYVVEAVPDSAAHQMRVVSAYMHKNGGSTDQVLNVPQNGPQLTPEAPHGANTSATAPIIADSSAGGNTQSAQTGPESSTGGFGPNTVGSAENPFKSAPKISKVETNTFENGGIYNEVDKQMAGVKPEDLAYDPVSERQSMSHALDRLVNDFEGEKADLPNKEAWSGEDLDTAMGILYQARQQGKQTGDYSEFNRWRKLIQEKGTNAGQMIQAFAKYTRTPEGILMDAAETLERTGLDEARRNAILGDVETQVGALERIGEGDLDGLIELIERNSEIRGTTGLFSRKTASQMDWALREVAKSYSDAEAFLRDVAVSQLRSIAADYLPVSPLEAVKNFRVMGMLSKASTVMRNLVSNNVFDPLETLSNDIGVPLDIALSKLTGQRTTAVDKSWFSKAKRQGSLEGLLKSYIQVGLDASTENARGRYEGTAGRTFKMTGNLFERLLSTWAKYEGYALNTTDEFQKGGIRAEAQRGIDELKSAGKLDAKALPTWADGTALQRTFQNDGRVARVMTGLRAAGNHVGLKDSRGGSFGAGDLALPFARVPGNLVSQAANYSPMGLVNGLKDVVRTVYQAKKGQLAPEMQAQAVRNVGRGFTGSVALAGFGALALAGLINVAGADDKDKEALERAQGKNGTQWNLSATMRWLNGKGTEWRDGDTLVSIGFLEPLNAIMAAGALMADAYREDGELSLGEVVGSSASATIQAVLDLPAMSSISSLIDSYTYAEGDTTAEKAADAAISYAGSQASSFLLPNFVKGIATGLDDTVRNQYSSGTTLGTARDSIVAGLPMLRKGLPASVDGFGRERTNTGNTALNLLNANLLSGQLRTYRQNAVEKELERISGSTGAVDIYPGKNAPYTVRHDNQSYSLTPEERDAYQRRRGRPPSD